MRFGDPYGTFTVLRPRSLFLADSGAQYLDGASDITRPLGLLVQFAEDRQVFSTALRGHIRLTTARFPG